MENTATEQCSLGLASSVLKVSQESNSHSSHNMLAVSRDEVKKPCKSCLQHEKDTKHLTALVEELQMEKKLLLAKVGGLLYRQAALESELKELRLQAVGSAAGDSESGRQQRKSLIRITATNLSSIQDSCIQVDKQAATADGSCGTIDRFSSGAVLSTPSSKHGACRYVRVAEESPYDTEETTLCSLSASSPETADQRSAATISAKQSRASTMREHLYADNGDPAARRRRVTLSLLDRRDGGDTPPAQRDATGTRRKTSSSAPSSQMKTMTPTRLRGSYDELDIDVTVSSSRVRLWQYSHLPRSGKSSFHWTYHLCRYAHLSLGIDVIADWTAVWCDEHNARIGIMTRSKELPGSRICKLAALTPLRTWGCVWARRSSVRRHCGSAWSKAPWPAQGCMKLKASMFHPQTFISDHYAVCMK
eukprot:6186643-Pleurochrysis_carterae.AAC.1